MVIPTEHFRSEYSNIPLRIAKGHFATGHSHINYYIDMTYTKYRLAEARAIWWTPSSAWTGPRSWARCWPRS